MLASRIALAVGAAVVAATLAAPTGAGADAIVAFQGTTAVYTGTPGQAHSLGVSQPIGVIEFKEPGVIAGSACNQVAPDRVQCPRSVATADRELGLHL
jgi:hypothetical protein